MALESGSYISDLVQSNPTGNDNRRQGDDHLRLIKKVLQTSFPNINGAVTATPADLNKTSDPTNYFPSGGIIAWAGLIANIPAGWKFCNGSGTTSNGIAVPDLRGRMIIASDADAGGVYDVRDTGGSKDIVGTSASHTLTISQIPAHTHTYAGSFATNYDRDQGGSGFQSTGTRTTNSTGGGGGHTHGISLIGKNVSPYYSLAYIIKD